MQMDSKIVIFSLIVLCILIYTLDYESFYFRVIPQKKSYCTFLKLTATGLNLSVLIHVYMFIANFSIEKDKLRYPFMLV